MDNLNEKYKELLKQGKDLFWKYGIKKVTVEEICEKAGTSRVTFYKYFQNKEKLAYHILKNIMDESLKEYREIMESGENFETKVEETILMKIRSSKQMSHELLNDVMGGDYSEILKLINDTRTVTMEMIENDYREAQKKGYIRKEVKIEFIIYYLNKIQEMVFDPHLEKHYSNSGELITEIIQFFFYGLLSHNNENKN